MIDRLKDHLQVLIFGYVVLLGLAMALLVIGGIALVAAIALVAVATEERFGTLRIMALIAFLIAPIAYTVGHFLAPPRDTSPTVDNDMRL